MRGVIGENAGERARRELEGRAVVVVGLARSGVAACDFLLACGAFVTATDVKDAGDLGLDVVRLGDRGVRLDLGGHREDLFNKAALVVTSPGVSWDLPVLVSARRAGVPVIGELELASRYIQGRIVAITGTKGKSTTTSVLGAMLREAGLDARVGGNIGTPAVSLLDRATAQSTFVLEVSSFQLESIRFFHPDIAVFLNFTDDHFDRHGSRESYASAKARIFMNQTENDWAVVNADDSRVQDLARSSRARQLRFSEHCLTGEGAFFDGNRARMRYGENDEDLFMLGDVRLPGRHLAVDILAAGAAARLLGATPESIMRAVRAHVEAEHVLERVAEIDGVTFYNDSKATNVEAARRGIEAFEQPVVAIMGGRHKGGDFSLLRGAAAAHTRAVLAIGEARALIAERLKGVTTVVACDSLREAVERAFQVANAGDVVVLEPACASFDMYEDYAHRGRAFKEEVRRLALARDGGAV
ncbi:MAG: UDP-N-acetylmuramoyl-L-alanine--D-glutamate ligase [Vicinamibacteria bacterium]|nr:UDP-N-acetylmuramoyl-L-alanine--D-glutamate ligase [Vicinamibacteria bacterium]